jgi:hypothetical protein
MAQFELITRWRVAAPLPQVWEAILHSERWPHWWEGLEAVEEVKRGDHQGIGNVRRYAWNASLYRLAFQVTATRTEPLRLLKGRVEGDVSGTGAWRFSQEGNHTLVEHIWNINMERPPLRLLEPLAHGLFRYKHRRMMKAGAQGLARHLGTSVQQE